MIEFYVEGIRQGTAYSFQIKRLRHMFFEHLFMRYTIDHYIGEEVSCE